MSSERTVGPPPHPPRSRRPGTSWPTKSLPLCGPSLSCRNPRRLPTTGNRKCPLDIPRSFVRCARSIVGSGRVILTFVEEIRTRTLALPDIRGEDRFLRISWHPSSSTVVFSHWVGSVCIASTPVSLPDASRVIDLLVGALRGVVSAPRRPNVTPSLRRLAPHGYWTASDPQGRRSSSTIGYGKSGRGGWLAKRRTILVSGFG